MGLRARAFCIARVKPPKASTPRELDLDSRRSYPIRVLCSYIPETRACIVGVAIMVWVSIPHNIVSWEPCSYEGFEPSPFHHCLLRAVGRLESRLAERNGLR